MRIRGLIILPDTSVIQYFKKQVKNFLKKTNIFLRTYQHFLYICRRLQKDVLFNTGVVKQSKPKLVICAVNKSKRLFIINKQV